jgi:UDP-N-acetylglucosamine 2-epimerase (non-hydrolysing)
LSVRVTHIVGARPNFMKAAPVMEAIARTGLRQSLIHTGQHYDQALSALLFDQLGLPQPDINLNIGSGSHAQQTGAAMTGIEEYLREHPASMIVVYGDVNSSLAGALVAAKLNVPIAHVEAGVRSFDRTRPEEINRLVIDRVADHLFSPSPAAGENLRREGLAEQAINCAGNVMIDSLKRCSPMADADAVFKQIGLTSGEPFVLVTLHRPATVDDPPVLKKIVETLSRIALECPVVFPVHPRTRRRIDDAWRLNSRLHLIEPVGYLQFVGRQQAGSLVITDSGGIQIETSYLGIPCLTTRDSTEWPETLHDGTNTLVGRDVDRLLDVAQRKLRDPRPALSLPPYWDGRASERIASTLATALAT